MDLHLTTSDIVVLSAAAACLVAAALLEMLRVVIPDIYEWVADHEKIKRETKAARTSLERVLADNREQTAVRDRRNAERFRMKSQLSRLEMMLAAVERDRIQIWHELGRQGIADGVYQARVSNRRLAETAARDFDSAPVIWRYANHIRVWAPSDRAARLLITDAFPAGDGYGVEDVVQMRPGAGAA